MSDVPNPYQPPEDVPQGTSLQGITFGEAVRRGFAAAHGVPAGAVWMLILLAPAQILSAVINNIMFGSDFFEKIQSGDFEASGGQPPPELFMMMGAGCFMCLWMLVVLFSLPWIWGGVVGQIRDRVMGNVPDSFGAYGKRYYGTMLLLLLLFFGAVIVISIPNAIVGQITAATQVTPGEPMTAEQMRALSRHPVNIISNTVTGLLMAAVGTIVNLVASAIAARGRGIRDGLSRGFSFCTSKLGTVFKLYLVYVLLILPYACVQLIPQLLTPGLVVGIIIAFVGTIYLAYLSVVNFGIAGSMYAVYADHGQPAAEVE